MQKVMELTKRRRGISANYYLGNEKMKNTNHEKNQDAEQSVTYGFCDPPKVEYGAVILSLLRENKKHLEDSESSNQDGTKLERPSLGGAITGLNSTDFEKERKRSFHTNLQTIYRNGEGGERRPYCVGFVREILGYDKKKLRMVSCRKHRNIFVPYKEVQT